MNEEIEELAKSISFRLMATVKHPDHDWLVEQLKILVDRAIRDTEL